MIAAQGQTYILHDALIQGTILLENGLMYRFERSKAIADDRGVPAKDFVVPMVYRTKKPAQSVLSCPELFPIRTPHPVWMLCHDLAIVGTTGTIAFGAHWSQQVIGFHEPQIPFPASTHALPAQSSADFLVSFTVERTGCQILSNSQYQFFIADDRLGSGALLANLRTTARIPRRRRQSGDIQHHARRIGLSRRYRLFAQSHFDERRFSSA